jgi:hypothetical protein
MRIAVEHVGFICNENDHSGDYLPSIKMQILMKQEMRVGNGLSIAGWDRGLANCVTLDIRKISTQRAAATLMFCCRWM